MSSPSLSSSAAPAAPKICFNILCKDPKLELPRKKGWRLRSGEFADLCARCFCSYAKGAFCEAFHSDASGWRSCESCGKRLHCGCIVSAPAYILLDAGGVDCIACAKKAHVMAPKQMSSSLLLPLQVSERMKDFPAKGRNQMISPLTGQWRQAANMWNVAGAQSELHQRLAYEFDRPIADRLISGGRSSVSVHEKKVEDLSERIASDNLNHVIRDRYANGTISVDSVSVFNTYSGEEGKPDILQDSGHLVGESNFIFKRKGLTSDPCSTTSGINFVDPNSCLNSLPPSVLKEDTTSPLIAPLSSLNDMNDPTRNSTTQQHRQTAPQLVKPIYSCPHNTIDPCGELQAHMRNGKPRADVRARAQLLPRYWPRLTDQEIQQISGDSNSVITPLFEKMLSASDAGRIGRLVLPKKCAEAYFPPIYQPEGLPLKVQDATGKEWVFQFRFWPNNNSRMYVLEGVTPCIQSMQLQAGDTVTFSRIDPEGKLVMGFRKASSVSTEQGIQTLKAGNGLATPTEVNDKIASAEFIPNLPLRPLVANTESRSPVNTVDLGSLSKSDKSVFIQKTGPGSKSSQPPSKKKGSTLGSKSKRLRIDHEDSIQLKLTWEAAQDLLRPPPNVSPSIVFIEGHEFEEYEDAPVIGLPTVFTTNQAGDKCQWAQCEECSKWRKLPVNALLPSRWTCSQNTSDPQRSSCSSAQEPSVEQLADFLPIKTVTPKRSKVKMENDSVEVSDGLNTLANLAILGEGGELHSSSQPSTTKHPRHRPGCSCIVCIQPPSGKGPKHKPTCQCNVCLTVKRRFRTLMLRREKRQSEKEAESAKKQLLLTQSPEMLPEMGIDDSPPAGTSISSPPQNLMASNDGVINEDAEQRKALVSPLKAQIDLNMHPEREEEPLVVAAAASMMMAYRDCPT